MVLCCKTFKLQLQIRHEITLQLCKKKKKKTMDIYRHSAFSVIYILSFNVNVSFRSAAKHFLNNEKRIELIFYIPQNMC